MKYTLSKELSFLCDAKRESSIFTSPVFGVFYLSEESKRVTIYDLKTKSKRDLSPKKVVSLIYWREREILLLFFENNNIKYLNFASLSLLFLLIRNESESENEEKRVNFLKENLKSITITDENSMLRDNFPYYFTIGSNKNEIFLRNDDTTIIFSLPFDFEEFEIKISESYLEQTTHNPWEIDEIVEDSEDVYLISHRKTGNKSVYARFGEIFFIDENTLLHSSEYLTFITLAHEPSENFKGELRYCLKSIKCPHVSLDFNISKKCLISIEMSKIFSMNPPFEEIGSFSESSGECENYPEILGEGNYLYDEENERIFELTL